MLFMPWRLTIQFNQISLRWESLIKWQFDQWRRDTMILDVVTGLDSRKGISATSCMMRWWNVLCCRYWTFTKSGAISLTDWRANEMQIKQQHFSAIHFASLLGCIDCHRHVCVCKQSWSLLPLWRSGPTKLVVTYSCYCQNPYHTHAALRWVNEKVVGNFHFIFY